MEQNIIWRDGFYYCSRAKLKAKVVKAVIQQEILVSWHFLI